MAKKKKAAKKAARKKASPASSSKTRFQTGTVRLVPRSQLNFLPGNAQVMTGQQAKAVQASIEDEAVGLVDTPVWNERTGNVVGGHHRISACDKAEGHRLYSMEVSVIDVDEETERAISLMLNNPRNRGQYDPRKLASMLAELPAGAQERTGFDGADRQWLAENLVQLRDKHPRIEDAIWGSRAEVVKPDREELEDDDVPELGDLVYTLPGDVWTLGNHRVLCGDSTKAAEVDLLLGGEQPFIMVTDPPYGVEYDASWRVDLLPQFGSGNANSENALGEVGNDDRCDWREAWALFPGAVAYVWHSAIKSQTVHESLTATRFEVRAQIVWDKGRITPGRGHYHWRHESCYYAARPGITGGAKWCGDRDQSTVWQIAKMHKTQGSDDDGKTFHSTQKPVECMGRPIRNHGGDDDDVYDPFLGSGTTLIACEQLGRRCLGIELFPIYVDLIIRRWQNLAGEQAVRQDGVLFNDLVADGHGRKLEATVTAKDLDASKLKDPALEK